MMIAPSLGTPYLTLRFDFDCAPTARVNELIAVLTSDHSHILLSAVYKSLVSSSFIVFA